MWSPEVGEAAAPERRKRRGGAGSRGPLLGLPGRDGGGGGEGHVARSDWRGSAADVVRPGADMSIGAVEDDDLFFLN